MAAGIILLMFLGSSLSIPSSRRHLTYGDEDLFREEAAFLSPADRQMPDHQSLQFPQLGDSFAGPQVQRRKRDGGSHGQAHGRRNGRRNGQRSQQPQQNHRQQPLQSRRREQEFQEMR